MAGDDKPPCKVCQGLGSYTVLRLRQPHDRYGPPEKVLDCYVCLWCNGTGTSAAQSTQKDD